MRYTQHTSESVSKGHPDKIADQISDAVLDRALAEDKNARVACETLVKDNLVLIAGEISAKARIDYKEVVHSVLSQVCKERYDINNIELIVRVGEQSPEIASGVDQDRAIGAGDQGIMYGYACRETSAFMPSPIYWAHQLIMRHNALRGQVEGLEADAKAQVTVSYQDNQPVAIKHVVLSTQHSEVLALEDVRGLVQTEIIDQVLPAELLGADTNYWVNPSGSFHVGGPYADCGLTGRKLMVDTYGGFSLHGGGAFSGKDSTKVDRTAAYMARYVAKHVVASGLADRCEVCLAYAIGVEEPVMIDIDTFGTAKGSEVMILEKVKKVFDFRPKAMIEQLGLNKPVFLPTATYGHFGREDQDFSWERLDQLDRL